MSGKKNLYKKDFILLKINENHTLKNFWIVAHCLSILYTWIPDQIQVKTPLEKNQLLHYTENLISVHHNKVTFEGGVE